MTARTLMVTLTPLALLLSAGCSGTTTPDPTPTSTTTMPTTEHDMGSMEPNGTMPDNMDHDTPMDH